MLPESLVKHQRVRALAGLLGQIVEPQTQSGFSSRSTINPTQFVRMLIRKGFITDLSKALHCLDLSSPSLTTTVNAILKPLECLTKIVTQFLAAQKKGQKMQGLGTAVNPPPPLPPLPNFLHSQTPHTEGSGDNTAGSTVVTAAISGTGESSACSLTRDSHSENNGNFFLIIILLLFLFSFLFQFIVSFLFSFLSCSH